MVFMMKKMCIGEGAPVLILVNFNIILVIKLLIDLLH